MRLVFRTLADVTVVTHFAFILFVLGGGFLVSRWPRIAWLHVPVLLWALGIEAIGWSCPLTLLEKWLRMKGGMGGYLGGFVDHWIVSPLFQPGAVSPGVRSAFALVPLALGAVAYWRVLRDRDARDALAATVRG